PMGMELKVTFTGRQPPAWPAVAELLAGHGSAVQMRMIDGELAFPDEAPPEGWRELRVALGGAMVTIRRGPDEASVVAWGNADAAQLRVWQTLAWALASAGDGRVQTPEGPVDAAAFGKQIGLGGSGGEKDTA